MSMPIGAAELREEIRSACFGGCGVRALTLRGAERVNSMSRAMSFFNLDIFQSAMEAPRTKMLYNLTRRTHEIPDARLHDSCVYNCTSVAIGDVLTWNRLACTSHPVIKTAGYNLPLF